MARYLFVCTGNICRSPMAEAFARSLLDGAGVASAGTMTVDGRPPSMGAVSVMAEVGIDLTRHRSRDLWRLDLEDTIVYAMHAEHLEQIRHFRPEVAAELLDPSGRSIEDPYGAEIEAFRIARDQVHEAVIARFAREGQ